MYIIDYKIFAEKSILQGKTIVNKTSILSFMLYNQQTSAKV